MLRRQLMSAGAAFAGMTGHRARRPRQLSVTELLLVAAMALFASIIGGVAGYGTGALMPLVLVPMVGAEPVVPIIAISALFTNTEPRARVSRT